MDYVLTLIANPATGGLEDGIAAAARAALNDLGADTAQPSWLDRGIACDIPFAMLAPEQAEAAVRGRLDGQPFDVVAQASEGRRKRLLVADMDSTMVVGETLDELADYAGLKEHIAAITARAMNGELDFKAALRERVGLLQGLDVSALDKTFARLEYMPGARKLVQTMRANGAYAVLVSGGFKYFTARVAAHCGFDMDLANDLVIRDGKLTGEVTEPILDRATKLETLIRVASERKIPLALTASVGDGANDLDMIRAAGLGVAYHAKPIVSAEARVRIDHGDLTALLYAQGYKAEDFVE
ncbi:phosphoserine phosphatase SerB [Telmatospirillum sp. J64-1]|uniref:phosphoserine phosphatase SerB n=1 Tax=Telmatospirillum sp. J64-1 TaxID=2502183 RepID=UPI00115DDD2B|nr:phosphoserine phosphatase SerB [Telmatospirillum sp. J64-1]